MFFLFPNFLINIHKSHNKEKQAILLKQIHEHRHIIFYLLIPLKSSLIKATNIKIKEVRKAKKKKCILDDSNHGPFNHNNTFAF